MNNEPHLPRQESQQELFYRKLNRLLEQTKRATLTIIAIISGYGAGVLTEKVNNEFNKQKEKIEQLEKEIEELKKNKPEGIMDDDIDGGYYNEDGTPYQEPEPVVDTSKFA